MLGAETAQIESRDIKLVIDLYFPASCYWEKHRLGSACWLPGDQHRRQHPGAKLQPIWKKGIHVFHHFLGGFPNARQPFFGAKKTGDWNWRMQENSAVMFLVQQWRLMRLNNDLTCSGSKTDMEPQKFGDLEDFFYFQKVDFQLCSFLGYVKPWNSNLKKP